MVALSYDLANVSRILAYHEQKVESGIAQCLMAGNMPLSASELSSQQKMSYMVNRCTLNANIQLPCLHTILGFHPLDARLNNDEFSIISERYMELIGFENQPFLVYRHTDTYHPHLHIVSTNIRKDGSQIYTHRLVQRLCIPATKHLEREFGLVAAQRTSLTQIEQAMAIKKLHLAGQPLKKSLRDILIYLQSNYSFSDILEWNALLRPFNIVALAPKNRGIGVKKGILYYQTDDCQKIISKGIPEVHISQELCFGNSQRSKLGSKEHSARSRIRLVLEQAHSNLLQKKFLAEDQLTSQGIELVELFSTKDKSSQLVVLDHQLRCAMHEQKLDLSFLLKDLRENPRYLRITDKNLHQKILSKKNLNI